MKTIASWEVKGGKDYLNLCKTDYDIYFYQGLTCGGVLPQSITDDNLAIEWMENPWGHKLGAGPVTVLKSDRPSLKRVFIY